MSNTVRDGSKLRIREFSLIGGMCTTVPSTIKWAKKTSKRLDRRNHERITEQAILEHYEEIANYDYEDYDYEDYSHDYEDYEDYNYHDYEDYDYDANYYDYEDRC